MKHDFIIAGGGIAGLTAAIALQKEGYDVKVFERAQELKKVGAGLGLGANAWKGLTYLGVTDELCQKCHVIKRTQFLDPNGQLLSKLNMERLNKKYGVAYFTVHRAQLQQSLLQHIVPGTLELGAKVVHVEQNETGVKVSLENGGTVEGKALIAADGIHSIVRKICLPNSMPRYAGYTCWRAVVKVPEDKYRAGEFIETWGPKGRFGIVPLNGHQIYWYACVNAPFGSKELSRFTTHDLYLLFRNYHSPIPEIIQWTKDEDLIWTDILDLKPLKQFAFKRVLLIGDAAHATTPNLGQGAGQAIEDSIVLNQIIKKQRDIETAFVAFEKLRRPKSKKIINMSWRIGKAAQIAHPALISIRNALLRLLPAQVLEKQVESAIKTNL